MTSLHDEVARLLCESRHVWCDHHDPDSTPCERLADQVLDLITEASEASGGR